MTAGQWVHNRVAATVKLQVASGGSVTAMSKEVASGYNEFQRVMNKNAGRAGMEDSYTTKEEVVAAAVAVEAK